MTGPRDFDDFASTPPVTVAEWRAFIAAMSKLAARMSAIEEAVRQANVLALVGSNIAPLIFAASKLFDVPPEHIAGKVQSSRALLARQAITWVGRDVYGRSSTEIARILKRDHTIILGYEADAKALRDSDPTFKALSDQLAGFARHPVPIALGDIVPPSLAADVGRASPAGE